MSPIQHVIDIFECFCSFLSKLTKAAARHEVVAGIFGVISAHLSGYWVKLGEVVSMETVVALEPAQSRSADREVGPSLGLHRLCGDVVNMDVMSCQGKQVYTVQ